MKNFIRFSSALSQSKILTKRRNKMNRDLLLSIKKFRFGSLSARVQRIFVLMTVTILLTAIIAFATIPGPDGVINSCYHKNDGALRIIDSTEQCKANEEALSFNQTGPQGPAGPSGTSRVYALRAPGPFILVNTTGNLLVASKDVPAGSYVIDVKLTAVNGDVNKHNIFCSLSTGDTAEATVPDRSFSFPLDGNLAYGSIQLHENYTFSEPATINVFCRSELMSVKNVVLTAIKVDSIQ
jgi:hypothetical protein